ncbi:4-hydroxy-tetrahydrodipicolinate reductase [Helicobacter sp. 11S02629-2]|uniref:4-hydroxy-tetrahydrodipicolinate reductase n=1 Tax=Helicobacter sp. 11S02629-2 TaxID=1476195 RepID=UPI000BA535F9|nr:4-hydroxy-tetrahydrodipicolinate reductase [Helicobacter sp. 11S02629-2]PAF45274.1 4-hydroxy-tetrahydrodipicolinate reductase [Helicobacter sp. 11S02629-2]
MLKIGILGAYGRVGSLVRESLEDTYKTKAVFAKALVEGQIPSSIDTTDYKEFLESVDVVIDFSSPVSTKLLVEHALITPKPLVIGTTGLDAATMDFINTASTKMPILYSTNMSKGVLVLNELVSEVAKKLPNFDIEILEMHHKYKKDAPSGTALSLADSALEARKLDKSHLVKSRDGICVRKENDIGMQSLRGGDLYGKHTVGFYGDGEFLELTHYATSRFAFANGALDCALWIANKPPKLYSIKDIFK